MYIFMVLPKYNQYTDLWEDRKDHYQALETMLDELPEDASLSVPSTYLAHVADRREVYEHTYHVLNGEKNQLKEHDVDYAVIRTGADAKYRKAFEEKGYTVWAEYDGHVILKSPHIN
jgi:hypothetical protein